ncbi:hypothetical protein Tco_0784049 [Tanacetum coccineum]
MLIAWIRRIENWSNAFSCEALALIRRIFLVGYGVLVNFQKSSNLFLTRLNRVISALKDGGGEFDGHLDEINLDLSEELADNGVSPIPTSLVAHESPQVHQLWERIGIGDAQGLMENGRNHKFVQPNVWGWMPDSQSAYSSYHLEGKVVEGGRGKKVLVAVAEGRRTTGVEDGTVVGLGYGISESRYILDITLRTRWL